MAAKRERTHFTGNSNRTQGRTVHSMSVGTGPIDFDTTARNALPAMMSHTLDKQVPIVVEGSGNQDFAPKLPGHDYRQFNSDPRETQALRRQTKKKLAATVQAEEDKPPSVVRPKHRMGEEVAIIHESRPPGHEPAPRWNPARWFAAPTHDQCPLYKEESQTWNHNESQMLKREFKAHDRLRRTVWRPEDVDTPRSESGDPAAKHPLRHEREEYYPGRSLLDGSTQESGNDFQIRPINLPDFAVPPRGGDPVTRMSRLRIMLKQRYAGRPGLLAVFRNCCLTKQGFAFPVDLQRIFDQIGVQVNVDECDLLVKAVDKDHKGACSFQEFADMILGSEVSIGGGHKQAEQRYIRHVTKSLVDSLLASGTRLGKAFCEADPERTYLTSKAEFRNAIGSSCDHVSQQAVEFLWASQFPGGDGEEPGRRVNWRDFMGQLDAFAHANRAPTPICLQGRKRQRDLLQRTFPLTRGRPSAPDLSRPEQDSRDDFQIIAGRLVPRKGDLMHKPRETSMLTEPFVDDIQRRAQRVERMVPDRIKKARLQKLLENRDMVHQDEFAHLVFKEFLEPGSQEPLPAQIPREASSIEQAAVSTPAAEPPPSKAVADDVADSCPQPSSPLASQKLAIGDFHAYAATQRTDQENQIKVEDLVDHLYKPEYLRKSIERVNDGLNRALRGHRPPRERPSHQEVPRHMNYWQARYFMEALADNISLVETGNGGKLKPSKIFKRLDVDADGYISLHDLRTALDKYKVQCTSAAVHAMFSELDKDDKGSIDIGEFTRNFEMHQGNLLDSMAKPIKCVYHEGGVDYAGPVQDKIDQQSAEIANRQASNGSAPDTGIRRSSSESASSRSKLSGTGKAIAQAKDDSAEGVYCDQVGLITGRARITDVIRARCAQWKPAKAELFTAPPRTRFGMTIFPDTRHITEASVPLSGLFMSDAERFKTTNSIYTLYSVPDAMNPQTQDSIRKHAGNEWRVERIRHRQREFEERRRAADEAATHFDELKVARKALNQLNYEQKCRMACA